MIWDNIFKNGLSKACGRQPLKKLKGYGLLEQTISLQIFQKLSSTNFIWSILEYFVLLNFQNTSVILRFIYCWQGRVIGKIHVFVIKFVPFYVKMFNYRGEVVIKVVIFATNFSFVVNLFFPIMIDFHLLVFYCKSLAQQTQ